MWTSTKRQIELWCNEWLYWSSRESREDEHHKLLLATFVRRPPAPRTLERPQSCVLSRTGGHQHNEDLNVSHAPRPRIVRCQLVNSLTYRESGSGTRGGKEDETQQHPLATKRPPCRYEQTHYTHTRVARRKTSEQLEKHSPQRHKHPTISYPASQTLPSASSPNSPDSSPPPRPPPPAH